jgi:hypothetical protein
LPKPAFDDYRHLMIIGEHLANTSPRDETSEARNSLPQHPQHLRRGYWFFIPTSAMSVADAAGMCPARDSLLASAALDPKLPSSLLWCSERVAWATSAAGPELTSRDVRCSVDMSSKADVSQTSDFSAIDPKATSEVSGRADHHRAPWRVRA